MGEEFAEALVASGRVEAQIVYLDPGNTLSYKYLVSQSLGGDLSPPLTPPQALGRKLVGKLEGGRNPQNGCILEVFSSWSPQASKDMTT